MGMRCTACGEVNRDEARFCSACGVRILARCTTCDSELPPGARFCDGCGAPVGGAEAGAVAGVSDDAGQQARKTVTIVFADLQGSTALQEGMDPESVRTLMASYYAAMREAVDAHAGRVVKFVGDGVMAVFGVPEVAEDDAVRAVRAAAAMQAAFEPIAASVAAHRGVSLALRAGVNTGEVVVDADDADVVGDAVNVASRLETAAGAGEVFVGDETWRLVRHAATFEPVAPLTVKGRAEPVGAHRLVELTEVADAGAAPFVGRSAELSTLRSLFDTVVQRREPRLATVIGSPGVGKSRLVGELRTALGDRATTLVGRVDQTGGTTFAPIDDLLAPLGTAEEATLAGTPEEAFLAVRRALELAARDQPVVAVLDDVQWAEPLLLDLVEHLAEWITEPVLLIAVARPELRELRPALTVPQGRVGAVIALEGLDRAATEQLARELLDSEQVPAPLLERLTAGTDGNPLFVRELVRMLIDDGVVRREGEGWTLAVEAAAVEVPPTIQSLLAARLDRLRAAERTVLERAAVIGAEVYRGALIELVPPEVRADLDNVLESLRRKELLEPAGTYWIDERVLRFHHALIRDAAYRRLLKDSRAGLHERVASWLVAKTGGGPDHDETIGYHLEQAQATRRDLGPLDDGARAVAADAAERLGRAARRALDRDDLLAAAGLSGRAVSCLDPDDPARAELLLTRCEALLGAGDVAAAAAAVDDLTRAAPGDSRLDAWATCFDVQLTSLVSTRALGDAEGRLVTAAAVLAAAGDNAGAAKAHRVHASVLARLGRVGDCEAALDRALGAAREAGDRRQMTSVLSAAPLAALWGPSPVPRAGGRCLDVIRLVRITTGAPAVESTSIRCQAVLEAFRGRLDAARSLIGSARTIAEDLGLRHGLLEVELFAGIVELCGDDAAAAEDHLARAQEGFTAMGVTTDAAQAAALRGRAALALGRPDDALTYVATSEDLGGQDLKTSIAWRAVKAEVLAARGDVGAATELAEAAVAVAAPTDALIDHADALTALAHVLQAGGDGAAAQRTASEARALYEQKGATALAERLRQPVVAAPSPEGQPGPGSLTPIGNAASRAYEEVCRLTAAGTPEGIAAVMAANVVYEDRRPHFAGEVVGLAANIEQLRIVRELRVDSIDTQVVAVRGEHMAVVASQWHSDFEVSLAAVVVTDDTGLITRGIHYDSGDLPAAMDKLDELYAEGLSPDDAKLVLASRAAVGTHLRRDWDAFHRVFTPDVRVVDHAPTGHAEIAGVEAFAEYAKAMVAVAPDYHMVVRRFVALGDRTMVGESISVVTGPAGGTYEHPRLLVSTIEDDGRVSCRESFELEQLEQAWARFHELSGGGDEIANDASRVYERVVRLALADRYDEVRELMAANRVRDDRRTGLMSRQEGAEASIENLRAVMQLGIAGVDVDVVALRGERLALLETHWHGEFEVAVLGVVGLDATGRSDLVVDFDSNALGDALEELDRLYIEMLPPAEAAQTRVHAALVQAHNRRDWDAFRRCWADDIVAINHGPASYGEIRGIEEFMELTKAMVDVAPDFKHVLRRILATSDRAVLVESTPPVVGSAGGEYVRVRYIVTRLRTPEGPIDLYETFEPEQLDEAWARYRELSNDEEDRLANTASRTYEAVNRALVGDRPDEALRLLAADVVRDDRRAGMQHRISGSAEVFPHLRAVAEIGITGIEMRVIAIRDDNLALVQFTWRSRFENTLLTLVRSNANGLIDLAISFDEADLRAALEELDELYAARYRALSAPDPTARYRASFELAAEGRWDELGDLIAEDFVFHDRRGGLGSVVRGRQHALDSTRTLLEIGAVSLEVEVLATRGDRLTLLRRLFRSEDGYAVELLWIHGEDEHGRNVLGVAFDPHDVVAAFDELDSLYLAGDGAPYADALRLAQFGLTAYRERDWDTMYRVYAPDIVSFDHRPAGYGEMRGADALIARHQAMVEIAPDYALLWTRILAVDTHGSLAESVAVSTSDTGAEYANPRLFITRARTPQGPITRFESFDLEQENLAWERYRALSAASEGEPGNAARHAADDNVAMDGSRRWFHAMVDGEWDTAIELLHPDYVMEDRRPTFGTRFPNREAMVPWMRETMAIGLTGVTLDTIALRGERLALCSRAWLARDFEVTSLCLMETDEEGRAVWAALYDPDQLEEALDELEARYLAGEGAPYASWMTASSAFRRSFNQHDWAALRELYTPDVVMVDHRNAGLGTLSGVDAVIDYHRAMADITPTHRLVLRRIPRIGPQLIVIEAVTRGDGAEGGAGTHELVRWMAMALDERGRVRRTEQFTDEAAASARFDELLAE